MILVIALVTSIIILLLSYSKNKAAARGESWFGSNTELEKFYASTELSAAQVQKQLVSAAAVTLVRIDKLENERYSLYSLSQDQIVSHDLWKLLDKTMKELDIERMTITSEADSLKDGWSQTIFRDASVLSKKTKKDNQFREGKGIETLFDKKREMLEKKVLSRILLSTELKS